MRDNGNTYQEIVDATGVSDSAISKLFKRLKADMKSVEGKLKDKLSKLSPIMLAYAHKTIAKNPFISRTEFNNLVKSICGTEMT